MLIIQLIIAFLLIWAVFLPFFMTGSLILLRILSVVETGGLVG